MASGPATCSGPLMSGRAASALERRGDVGGVHRAAELVGEEPHRRSTGHRPLRHRSGSCARSVGAVQQRGPHHHRARGTPPRRPPRPRAFITAVVGDRDRRVALDVRRRPPGEHHVAATGAPAGRRTPRRPRRRCGCRRRSCAGRPGGRRGARWRVGRHSCDLVDHPLALADVEHRRRRGDQLPLVGLGRGHQVPAEEPGAAGDEHHPPCGAASNAHVASLRRYRCPSCPPTRRRRRPPSASGGAAPAGLGARRHAQPHDVERRLHHHARRDRRGRRRVGHRRAVHHRPQRDQGRRRAGRPACRAG